MQNLDIKLKRFDLHWLIKSIPEGFSGVSFLAPDGIWLNAFVEKYFQGVVILASVLFVLYREALVVELAANAGGRGFESHRRQNLFFTIYSIL